MTQFIMLLMILVIMIIIMSLKIVPKNEVYIIERLGKYYDTWTSGVHLKFPFIDRVVKIMTTLNMILEIRCNDMETYEHKYVDFEVSALLKISDYHKYAYSQAQNQFENLIHDELSDIILKCPIDKIDENLEKIEYNLFKRVEASPVMKNIGLICPELSIRMIIKTNC